MTENLTEEELAFIHRALKFYIGFVTEGDASKARDIATKIWGILNDVRAAEKSGVV